MNIELIVVGKTDSAEVARLVEDYKERVGHYLRFGITTLPDAKNTRSMSEAQQKRCEGEAILRQLQTSDYVVLMDERGKEYTSEEWAAWMQKRMASGCKRLVFVIGGPYGFAPSIHTMGNEEISLSKMTLSHQMIRLLFVEQIYRAMTILNGEPYHHE